MSLIIAQAVVIDTGTALAGVGVILGAMAGAVGLLFRLLILGKDREIMAKQTEFGLLLRAKEVEFQAMETLKQRLIDELSVSIKSYRELARESIDSARQVANAFQKTAGLETVPVIAPVVPESNSEPTEAQEVAADISTMRAEVAAVKLAMGQQPRVAGRDEPSKPVEPAAGQ